MKSRNNFTAETNIGADYSDEQREWLMAIDRWKMLHRRIPTCCEVLGIALAMGYRKVDPATTLPTHEEGSNK